MLQLGEFIWPNDPERLVVSYGRKTKTEMTGDGLWSIVDQGRLGRTFVGEGIFYGESAYTNFSALAQMLYSGNAQTFTHPKWAQARVLLTALEVTEECEGSYLRYSFTMLELPPT